MLGDFDPGPPRFTSWRSLMTPEVMAIPTTSYAQAPPLVAQLQPMAPQVFPTEPQPLPSVGGSQFAPELPAPSLNQQVAPLIKSAQFDPGEGVDEFFGNGEAPANGDGVSPVAIGVGLLAVGAAAWYFFIR